MAARKSGGTWTTTVDEVVRIFRDALEALIPVAERARIPWRDAQAYDDWDAITETLFEQIVVNSIAWGLGSGFTDLTVPRYGFRQEEFAPCSYVAVVDRTGKPGDVSAFHSLTDGGSSGFNFVNVLLPAEAGVERAPI